MTLKEKVLRYLEDLKQDTRALDSHLQQQNRESTDELLLYWSVIENLENILDIPEKDKFKV